MKITTQLERGLDNVVGIPVYPGNDPKNIYGIIIEYNPETGIAVMELDEEKLKNSKWNPIVGENIGLSSSKREQYAVYEKEPAHGAESNGVILAPFNTKEEAEQARKKYGYNWDNYYVDKLK